MKKLITEVNPEPKRKIECHVDYLKFLQFLWINRHNDR